MTGFWTWLRPCCDWFAPCDHPPPLPPVVRPLPPVVRSFYDWPIFRSQVGRNLVASLVWLGLNEASFRDSILRWLGQPSGVVGVRLGAAMMTVVWKPYCSWPFTGGICYGDVSLCSIRELVIICVRTGGHRHVPILVNRVYRLRRSRFRLRASEIAMASGVPYANIPVNSPSQCGQQCAQEPAQLKYIANTHGPICILTRYLEQRCLVQSCRCCNASLTLWRISLRM